MSKCQSCGSDRVMTVCGKTSDLCYVRRQDTDKEWNGYVPSGIGLGNDEDYIEFDYCLNCGQMQGKFPVAQGKLPKELR